LSKPKNWLEVIKDNRAGFIYIPFAGLTTLEKCLGPCSA